jgi:hypothetical protein
MNTISDKVHHVLNAPNTDGTHTCHWPGCPERCKPAFFSCRRHWFTWPPHIRAAIWREYKPGQEETKTPSIDYLKAVTKAIEWAQEYEAAKTRPSPDQGRLDL